jgi:hypothetical protein
MSSLPTLALKSPCGFIQVNSFPLQIQQYSRGYEPLVFLYTMDNYVPVRVPALTLYVSLHSHCTCSYVYRTPTKFLYNVWRTGHYQSSS